MQQQYMITGHCANFSVQFPDGRRGRQMLFKGQLVPSTATQAEIDHHLSINAIAPVAGQSATEPAPQQPVETSLADVSTGLPDGHGEGGADVGADPGDTGAEEPAVAGTAGADPEADTKRAEARAKLPADGSKPDGRMGQPVWVEYLVGKGYDYAELAKQDKKDLVELANRPDQ